MPKTKRLVTALGSTLDPLYRHVQAAHFRLSPFDKNGNKVARCLYINFLGGDKRLKMENFKLTTEVDPSARNTAIDCTYRRLTRQQLEEHLRPDRGNFPRPQRQNEGVQQGHRMWAHKTTARNRKSRSKITTTNSGKSCPKNNQSKGSLSKWPRFRSANSKRRAAISFPPRLRNVREMRGS